MTATCTLCGQVLTVPDCLEIDVLRDRKTLTVLAIATFQHLATRHSRDDQAAVDRAEFPPGKPNNILTLIEASSALASLLTGLSYLKSEDSVFVEQMVKMRETVDKACAQKEVVSVIG